MTMVLATSAVIGTIIAKYFFSNNSKEEPKKMAIKEKEST
jgi:hypothetical protein